LDLGPPGRGLTNYLVIDADEEIGSEDTASEDPEEASEDDSLSDIITRAQGDLGSVLQTPAPRRRPTHTGGRIFYTSTLHFYTWLSGDGYSTGPFSCVERSGRRRRNTENVLKQKARCRRCGQWALNRYIAKSVCQKKGEGDVRFIYKIVK
jgi:hypothetical protein